MEDKKIQQQSIGDVVYAHIIHFRRPQSIQKMDAANIKPTFTLLMFRKNKVLKKEMTLGGRIDNLEALMTQNGKIISLSISHDTANIPNNTLAPSSLPEYLKILAPSRNTSLASCTARTTDPIRKNLSKSKQYG